MIGRNAIVGSVFAMLAVAFPIVDAASQDVRHVLAPTGTLRVGVYPGSPTSEIRDVSGGRHGLAVELGNELGRRLGVPVEIVEYQRAAEVVDAIAAGLADMTVTNASAARAERVAFTEPVMTIELGFLVPAKSNLSTISELDQPARRVGVTQGGTSEKTLRAVLPKADLVPVASMAAALQLLGTGGLDAYATNKSVLFQMSDDVPGSRVLAERWGVEHLAIALPKGRDAASSFLAAFVAEARTSGFIDGAAARAGLRGRAAAGQ